MTEDEAKSKWCPMVRIHEQPAEGKGPNMYAYNRPGIMGQMTCIASECMAWRWQKEYGDGKTEGYCGLAGTP